MRLARFLLACAAAALPLAGTAAGIDQLRAFLTDTASARGNFTQQVRRTSGQTLESTQGRFAFVRPAKFRWEVRKPFEQLMVSDGKRLWFHDIDLNQVTVRRLDDALASTPAALLFGGDALEAAFELSELGRQDDIDWVQALPRRAEPGYDRIAIGMRDGLPAAMEVDDAFGRTSVFVFSDIERDPALDDSLFQFEPPANADLIEQ